MDVVQIIRNWHKAADGRGLSDTDRHWYFEEMKMWILEDWIPWPTADYSLLDVNRSVLTCMKWFSCQKENVVSIEHYEHKTQHYLSESITLCHLCQTL